MGHNLKKNSGKPSRRGRWRELLGHRRILLTMGVSAFFMGALILFALPALQPVRDSLAFTLVMKLLWTAPLCYFGLIHKHRPPVFGRVLAVCTAVVPWIAMLLTTRMLILFCMVLAPVIGGYCVWCLFKCEKKTQPVLYAALGLLVLMILFQMEDYTFLHAPGGLHFWQVPLIVSLLATGVTVYLLIKDKIMLRDNRLSERIALPFAVWLMSFVLVWAYAMNLNYCLDTSRPEVYSAPVVEREMDSNGKSGPDYILTVQLRGEKVDIKVSDSVYHAHEEGSVLTVTLYDGAFGHPYYIYEGP